MPSTFDPTYDTEIDAGRESVVAPDAAPAIVPPGRRGDRFSQEQASDAEIGQAVGQLNAGQPVTALPRQEWSPAQGQAFAAKLDEFDRQAKVARAAAQQAAIDAQMLNQMSMVAKSTKDIEIARRNIDVMGLQRDIQNGVPIHEAIARRPNALGGGFASAYRATAPVAPPQWVAPSAASGPGHFVDSAGRVHIAPETGEAPGTEGKVLKDPETQKRVGIAYSTGPRSQRVVLDALDKGITPAIANQIYSSQERGLMHELADIEARAALLDDKNPKHQYFLDVQNQLKDVRKNRSGLIHGSEPTTTTAAPVNVRSKAERDALAPGTRYIGPDGRTAIKQ